MTSSDNVAERLLVEVSGLRTDLKDQTHYRVRNTWLTAAVVVVLFGLLSWVAWHQADIAKNASCTAVNGTNATLLRMVDRSVAGAPLKAPAGSTPEQVKQYAEYARRSAQFVLDAHRDLAPKPC